MGDRGDKSKKEIIVESIKPSADLVPRRIRVIEDASAIFKKMARHEKYVRDKRLEALGKDVNLEDMVNPEEAEGDENLVEYQKGEKLPNINQPLQDALDEAGVKHFTAAELTRARRWGMEQVLPPPLIANMVEIAKKAEEVRRRWQGPLIVVSGYRSPEYNALVGGAKTSRHMRGMAIDLMPVKGDMRRFARIATRVFNASEKPMGLGVYDTFIHIDVGDRQKPTKFR